MVSQPVTDGTGDGVDVTGELAAGGVVAGVDLCQHDGGEVGGGAQGGQDIAGGGKGAAIGAAAGAGAGTGVQAMTKGEQIVLKPETLLHFKLTGPVTVTASDGVLTDTDTVAITVTPVADITSDTVTTAEDTRVAISPTANDSDVDADPLAVTAVGTPLRGSAVIEPGNVVRYTPAADYFGPDSFSYTVSDGHGGEATAVVRITVTPVNDAPVAVDDSVSPAVPVLTPSEGAMLVSRPIGKNSVVTMTKQATVSEKIAGHGDDAGLSLLFSIMPLFSGECAGRARGAA